MAELEDQRCDFQLVNVKRAKLIYTAMIKMVVKIQCSDEERKAQWLSGKFT